MIDLTIDSAQRKKNIRRCRENGIVLPTYAQMRDPTLIPAGVKRELADIGLWDVHVRNLFRINWHNEPVEKGGGFGGVNYIELPQAIAGPTLCAPVGNHLPAMPTMRAFVPVMACGSSM